jgi:iron complex outermembrane receptor protein
MTRTRRRGSRFAHRRRAHCTVAIALGTLLAPCASSVTAQQQSGAVADLGRVDVTGSNIKRVEGETGLPLQVITREELLRGGVQTAQELLQRISANQSFGSFNEAMGELNTLVGFTSASLRGLGSQRTLVLLDGRRLAPYALSGGQSVDLSAIPSSAIDRVEILKDGASAVYGTDAIGGVINFILRKDFTGVELNANYYATEQGGGNNGRVNATAGKGSLAKDGYNAFVSVDYFKQDSLRAAQRESTKTAYLPEIGFNATSPSSFPANISQGPHSLPFNPTIPATGATADSCLPPISFPTFSRPQACGFDYASVTDTIPEVEKTNVVARFTGRIDADTQFFAEGAYYSGSFTQRISPTPVMSTFGPVLLPPTSPFYPADFVATVLGGDPTLPVNLRYRTVELGPRVDRANVDQWNAVVGLEGMFKGWDYTVATTYTSNRQVDNYVSGFVSDHLFTPLIASGVIDPFAANTPAALDMMRASQISGAANDNRARNYGVALKASNDVYKLPAGPVAVAFGVDARRERLEQSNADFFASGDVLGNPGLVPSLPAGSRTVWSLFGEVNVPVVRNFEVDVAARYDHYSDFGSTTNPKVTLRWQPSKALLLRGSWGTGFRAPTLSDLFQPQLVQYNDGTGFYDTIRCPVTGDSFDCDGIPIKTGGNPALQPERSHQLNVGIVIEPVPGVSASVDYYSVSIRNVIATVGLDAIFHDYAQWGPSYVVRKPPDAQYPDLPGPIDYVVQTQTNVGRITTSGLDLNLRWQGRATPLGKFSLNLDGTYVLDYQHKDFASLADAGGVGTRPDLGTGVISRYRQYAQLDWTWSAWGATLANTYQSGYRECDLLTLDEFENCTSTRNVASYTTWDVQGRYTGFRNATLMLGVQNLFDRAPPLSNTSQRSGTSQAGIDPTYGDPRGRMYYAAVRYVFK